MKRLLVLVFTISLAFLQAQHILQRENGVIFNGVEIISPPNLNDGFGSAADGMYGDSLSYFYEEQNNSYNGVDLVGSQWMSYGDLLPKVLPGVVTIGLGFNPDTFRWEFTADSIFVSVKDAETSNFSNYRFEYQKFSGPGTGVDSLHIYDTILIEPSLVKVYEDISFVSIREKYSQVRLHAFPNPCQQSVQLRIPKGQDLKQVIVQDINGRVFNQPYTTNSAGINIAMDELNHGLYVVAIETTNGNLYYEKILVR